MIYIKVYLFGLYFRLVNCIILFVNCARTVRAERLGGPLPWLVPFTLIVPNLALTNNRNNEYYDPCDITTLFGIFFGTSKNQNLPELRYPLLVTPRLVYYVVSGSKHPWTWWPNDGSLVNAICPNLSAYGLSIIGDGIASARAKNIIIRSLTQDIKHDFVQMLLVVKHLTAYGS